MLNPRIMAVLWSKGEEAREWKPKGRASLLGSQATRRPPVHAHLQVIQPASPDPHTCWNLLSNAASFSMCSRYSARVVAPMQCSSPIGEGGARVGGLDPDTNMIFRADRYTVQLTAGEHGLEQVGCVHFAHLDLDLDCGADSPRANMGFSRLAAFILPIWI